MHKVFGENDFSFITFRIDQFNFLCYFFFFEQSSHSSSPVDSKMLMRHFKVEQKRINHIFGLRFYNTSIKTIALIFKILPIT